MELRRATESDLPILVRLCSSVQELHARNAPTHVKMPTSDPGCEGLFRQALAEPTACLVVAEDAERVVGFIFAQELKREENWLRPALRVFTLEHIAVDPDFQRKGVGSALLNRFLVEAQSRGVERAELVCWNFNEEAKQFFRRHGFRELHARLERVV